MQYPGASSVCTDGPGAFALVRRLH